MGARKHRNIRDNLFVVNAVLNSVKQGTEQALDLCAYDVDKCFDSLWTYECMNYLYEAGLKNDKLPLLFKMNQSSQIAVRTPIGLTRRENINIIIMQGAVWGSLLCAATTEKKHLYKYKGEVDVPPLEMVDDIHTLQNCEVASEAINSQVNAFIEQKKLTLGAKSV